MDRHLPLRPNVPYRRRDGSRAILEENFVGELQDTETRFFFAPHSGSVFSSSETPQDIIDFYIEPAIWRTRSGLEVKVTTRDSYDYPFCYDNVTLSERGYYYRDNGETHLDLVDYVRPLATTPFEYPIRNRTKPPIYPPSRTYNPLCNMYAEMERVTLAKLKSGEYKPVPDGFKTKWGTGVHMSTQNPELLAYFPTLRHWQRRVPQQIRAGRYLRQCFPNMHDDEIRRMSALCSGGELKFYSRWQDMLKAYKQLSDDGIVSSCMSDDKWGDMHPLMVYDNSDVELAVLYIDGSPVARALYNKQNKYFPMIYGQWEKMEQALYKAGFTHSSMCGAKIRKLPRYVSIDRSEIDLDTIWEHACGNTILMPYIDHERALDRSHNCSTRVYLNGDHVVISYDNGTHDANDHSDAIMGEERCTCDHCDDAVDEDDTSWVDADEMRVCPHCFRSYVVDVFTSRRSSFTALEDTARDNFIYIEGLDRWVEDTSAANEFGYYWSEFASEYIHEDYLVWVDSEDDWYPDSEIGKTIVWDEEQSVYMLKEDYEALMAEREKEAEEDEEETQQAA